MLLNTNYSSSSDDENFWPPPGRRKRHPAGDTHSDNCSVQSDECASKFLNNASNITCSSVGNTRFYIPDEQKCDTAKRKCDTTYQFSSSVQSSSGVFSYPNNRSCQSGEMPNSPFFSDISDGFQSNLDPVTDKFIARFGFFNLNEDVPQDAGKHTQSSTPVMLRRFLNDQSTISANNVAVESYVKNNLWPDDLSWT